jgi:transmembrane sensor
VVLADGTRMTLSTASRATVRYEAARRRVDVPAGEALFEVAKDPRRPFIVGVGGAEVVATGTAFVVRSLSAPNGGARALSVTLLEGQVIVSHATGDGPGSALRGSITMKPGERIRVGALELDPIASGGAALQSQGAQLDRPKIDQILAWRRGEVVFADAPLLQALAEMNRYCSTPILAAGKDELVSLRVSGSFRAGDNAGFAAALAELHGLRVNARADRIELSVR